MNKFVSLVFLFAVLFLDTSNAIQCRQGARVVQGDDETVNSFQNLECPDTYICSRIDITGMLNGVTGNMK